MIQRDMISNSRKLRQNEWRPLSCNKCKLAFLALLIFVSVAPIHAAMLFEWKLDDAAGSANAADSTGNGYSGFVTNATFLPTGGILGGCVQFNGAGDQRISLNTNGVFPVALSTAPYQYPISVSVWFKPSVATGGNQLFSLGVNNGSIYHACRQQGYLDERAQGLDNLLGSGGTQNTGWNNIVCVWSGVNGQAIYTNGVLDRTGAFNGVTNRIVQFALGSLYRQIGSTPANPFAGLEDDAAVWNEALTDQQIAAIYGLGHFSAGNASDMPQFLAAFMAGTNTTIHNISWMPTNGLSGALGSVGGAVGTTNAYVVLDSSGNGMEVIGAAVPPTVSSFKVAPGQAFAGDTVVLSWNVGGADTVTIDQGIGTVSLTGSSNITTSVSSSSSTITWTLVASNNYGATTNYATLTLMPTPGPLKLLAHWNLDETNGTTAHNSLGTNVTGQFFFQNPNAISPAWEPTGGYIGGDLFFTTDNTTNQVVVRANLSGVVLTNYPFTMAAWVNTEDVVTRNETVLSLCDSNSASAYYCLQVDAGQARLAARNGGELDLYGGYVYGSGTYADWHYIVTDFERDNLRKIYVDGTLTGTDTYPLGGFVPVNRFSAGAIDRYQNPGISAPYTGHADDAALFTGTLTPDEVTIFFHGASGLGLNTYEMDMLRNAFLETNSATVHGATWVVADLSGSLGTTVGTTSGSLGTSDAAIVMDTNGFGMQISTSVPGVTGMTPSSPVIGSSGSQTLGIIGVNFLSDSTVTLSNVDTAASLTPTVTFINSSNLTINANLTVVPHSWSLQVSNSTGFVSSAYGFAVVAPPQPKISSISLASGNTQVVLAGTNGTAGLSYSVLTSTNVALPLSSWTPMTTNVFGSGGSFGWTNNINPSTPQLFYIIKP